MTVCHCVGCAPGLASYRLGRRQDMCMYVCVCVLLENIGLCYLLLKLPLLRRSHRIYVVLCRIDPVT